ncbi:MAG: ABC transporter substrate-binding protein [Paenibacillus macerans]|uniref:Bacterial extracellular solute-binding family protein n=1 Tax=Paenibacillus macerans TaxID=44252 RepID=A0A090Y890_PAEMA|nr:ABC transporter substrate-binding protein [Paenibacillus macerans]KFM94421.1 bacterial extracellular solute-binding family protein [Paenibacillus macerans]MBS5913369.1 carbohydrate ABC transporter substrate-binding protein [Paenibacillus macerans]MCY7560184.1 ABC transporter substrate-binding protein [Paenibacillus macerans]MDU7474932.1 ABC transporter substrate-binding protein [Paenibacillus macerans]MEC0135940.1 ABC transporter substrate-binding protein [Paenibacillus macerans]
MKVGKLWSLVLALTLFAGLAAGCGGGSGQAGNGGDGNSGKAEEIYFLNFKPEIAAIYEKIAKDYEAETGVKVKVVTAAAGTYETTLKSEIAKSEAPTIFQINGPVGYQNWKDYALDLKDTKLYSYLSDQSLAVTNDGGVYGIPYVVEGYGIIYNNAIMQKYFALPDKAVSISSMEEVNNFDTLKAVVEDMTAKADKLGIKGVFSSTSLASGEQWRWQTHLANYPFFYEFKEDTAFDNPILAGMSKTEVEFKYNSNFKNLFDLYINNSVTKPTMLGSKSVTDSMAEFALGQSAMVQNGNWAWAQINEVDGNVVKAEDIKFLPIYTGMSGEESQGLAVGTENYLAVNSKVSPEKQQASIAFLEWLFSSDKGKAYVTNELGFIAPFNTFKDNEKPADPLAKEVSDWMNKDGITSVPWAFAAFPSEEFKNVFGDALLQYAQGNKTWDDVVTTVKDSWKAERAK